MDPLIVDVYEDDLNGHPNWPALLAAGPPWAGAILKATEGLHYAPSWFGWHWTQLANLTGPRLGQDFFRGAYHYLRMDHDGAAQADYYCDLVDAHGGRLKGDIWPIVDVEWAGNADATADEVIGCVTAFSARCKERTGKPTILYGGSMLHDLGIRDHMGCEKLWVARYTRILPKWGYERIGWHLDELFAWQYCGGTESYLEDYPKTSPLGKVDISAVLANGGGEKALNWLRGG